MCSFSFSQQLWWSELLPNHQTPPLSQVSRMTTILWSYIDQSLFATLAGINVQNQYPLISLCMVYGLNVIMFNVLLTAHYTTDMKILIIIRYCIFLNNLFFFFFFVVKGKIILNLRFTNFLFIFNYFGKYLMIIVMF